MKANSITALTATLLTASAIGGCGSISSEQKLSIEHQGDSLSIVHIKGKGKYLLLPIQEKSDEALVKLYTGSESDTDMDIRLAVDSIDYYVPYTLPEGKDSVTFYIKKLSPKALAWDKMQLSDTFSTENTDYYRPLYHHTAPYGWMNDPNGMIYKDGEYHLYYQYNPYGSRWGNMHWGHAVSKDMLHWDTKAPAIARDTLGHIFSGSTIVDKDNTAGFGKGAIIAFYTSHKWINGKQWQAQSIAYSTDNGYTYKKYDKNPVLVPADGVQDFRDPKVFWYEPKKMWYMIVSADVEMRFYESKNLKDWTYLSSFGQGWGVQPNQFECPDFFELPIEGTNEKKWVMIVNINPGCFFGGSATEYFIGDFDGKTFTPSSPKTLTKWLDWGKDHYAAVTMGNLSDRTVVIPWTSNWQYANYTPIKQHRGANGLPREIKLYRHAGELYLSAEPLREAQSLRKETKQFDNQPKLSGEYLVNSLLADNKGAFELEMTIQMGSATRVGFDLMNEKGEKTSLYFDKKLAKFVMDRTQSGITDFGLKSEPHRIENHDRRKTTSINYQNDFALSTWAPLSLLSNESEYKVRIFVDKYTIEAFIDGGRIAMTNQVFPREPYNALRLFSEGGSADIKDIRVYRLSL